MAVKYYHILGFDSPAQPVPLGDNPEPAFYMGKTSDLAFKTEPDKSIDLDDGTTEVGSEKLSLSFSLLGKLQNPWPLSEIWLVPVCSDYKAENPEIIRVFFRGGDYQLEEKSGDTSKVLFSATLRYAAGTDQYEAISGYWASYSIVTGYYGPGSAGQNVVIKEDSDHLAELSPVDLLVEGAFAFVCTQFDKEGYSLDCGSFHLSLYNRAGLVHTRLP